ncbi:MAG: enoyl-CoA hydratase [Aestuariivita sp.]|nr:enoyl-CoA hydratase [Aestuariivita sp.]
MAFETIIVETEDHISTIKLNRPDALNALNQYMLEELCTALEEADQNNQVRCVILTGSDKAFAAGADIKEMSTMSYVDVFNKDLFAHPSNRLMGIRKPIIAAVSGYALGGGCELAMTCDFIIASDNAQFGQPEINLGVIPGMGGSQRLTHAIGKSKAMDMTLTGRFMSAEEAERSGLVSRVVPSKKLLEEALLAAHKIAEKSMMATRVAKESVNQAMELPLTKGLTYERRVFHALFATEDQSEGMAAFLEKRTPQFRDK